MLRSVFAPKAHGARLLHMSLARVPLEPCFLFSAGAALLGAAGQTNYCAANGFLDALASARQAGGTSAVSVQWGPWAEVGMATDARVSSRMTSLGIAPIPIAYGVSVLQHALNHPTVSVVAMIVMQWAKWQQAGRDGAYFEEVTRQTHPSTFAETSAVQLVPAIEMGAGKISQLVESYVGHRVSADAPLMDSGLDSLAATELLGQMQRDVGDTLSLPSTLVFEAPTVRQLVAFFEAAAPSPARTSAAVQLAPAIEMGAGKISQLVESYVGHRVSADAPLMDSGLDSLAATELLGRCNAKWATHSRSLRP
eukprot:3279596-Prymnesium_polylepis.1